jgi:beta-glucosidase-like glycosyl hydrolase
MCGEPKRNEIIEDKVKLVMEKMTLREKIAQMIISHSEGTDGSENSSDFLRVKDLILKEKIGGVIFFKGTSKIQTEMTNRWQEISQIPLLISADYERGTGMRLTDGSIFPNNMALGATDNEKYSYEMGKIIAEECRILGVHQNYAPVMDINNNPKNPIINVRAYGDNAEIVSKMGTAFIKGMQEVGVIATAKHFPGHGDTDIDSHNDLPVLPFDMERMNNLELKPFQSSIDAGVKSVMIAHLSFPELEKNPKVPSSLSKSIVNDLLIEKMGFNGLIVTDALNMSGITKNFSAEEIAVMCVEAGIDLILMPVGEIKAINAIEAAVKSGSISEERIDVSCEKILRAKNELGLFEKKVINTEFIDAGINSEKARKLAREIADASMTLVKNNNDIIPLKNNKDYLVISINNTTDKNPSTRFLDGLGTKMQAINSGYKMLEIESGKFEIETFINEAQDYETVIIPVFSKVVHKSGTVGIPDKQVELIIKLIDAGKKVAIISFGNPYLLKGFSVVDAYIAAYSDSPASVEAGIKALTGEIGISGKLPVTISDEFKTGFGIKLEKK